MSVRLIAIATAAVSLVFGLATLVVPAQFVALFGVELTEQGLFGIRLAGVFILGYTALDWYARDELEAGGRGSARRAIISANLVVGVLGFGVHLYAQLAGLLNELGWTSVVLFFLLSIGWGYAALVARREG